MSILDHFRLYGTRRPSVVRPPQLGPGQPGRGTTAPPGPHRGRARALRLMGYLVVETGGSFPSHRRQFSAQSAGHAHAVAQAIAYLAEEVLPAAIAQDHRLHKKGAMPDRGFEAP